MWHLEESDFFVFTFQIMIQMSLFIYYLFTYYALFLTGLPQKASNV